MKNRIIPILMALSLTGCGGSDSNSGNNNNSSNSTNVPSEAQSNNTSNPATPEETSAFREIPLEEFTRFLTQAGIYFQKSSFDFRTEQGSSSDLINRSVTANIIERDTQGNLIDKSCDTAGLTSVLYAEELMSAEEVENLTPTYAADFERDLDDCNNASAGYFTNDQGTVKLEINCDGNNLSYESYFTRVDSLNPQTNYFSYNSAVAGSFSSDEACGLYSRDQNFTNNEGTVFDGETVKISGRAQSNDGSDYTYSFLLNNITDPGVYSFIDGNAAANADGETPRILAHIFPQTEVNEYGDVFLLTGTLNILEISPEHIRAEYQFTQEDGSQLSGSLGFDFRN